MPFQINIYIVCGSSLFKCMHNRTNNVLPKRIGCKQSVLHKSLNQIVKSDSLPKILVDVSISCLTFAIYVVRTISSIGRSHSY